MIATLQFLGLFLIIPAASGWVMLNSFIKKAAGNGRIFLTVCEIFIMGFTVVGFAIGIAFDASGVNGGEPLSVYEDTGNSASNYATISHYSLPVFITTHIVGLLAYILLFSRSNKLSPIIYTLCNSALVLSIVWGIAYITHTGLSWYYETGLLITFSVLTLQSSYLSLIFLYVGRLKRSWDGFVQAHVEGQSLLTDMEHLPGWQRFLYRHISRFRTAPLVWVILMFPLQLVIQLILVLFGQRPDSAIRTFLDTSSYNYSRLPIPPPDIIPGSGHYLCTVAAGGHAKWVKPVRDGIRHGHVIKVNRQLMIANAFEHVLEQYTPRFHRLIRGLYDRYGYPVSKHIRSRWTADLVYLLMKPLEWIFLLVLYTTDKHPENRIHIQSSEMRGKFTKF
ncbi:DUF6688 domain-containing protein [Paenibacillus xylanexedens]|uniref:DUF6688 domain-containing protein n=1 Tax=Paenibacillus xylanexedens TaxID=528191 RepID=UPI0011A86124|nr:DUF6688 family protein [Paenibacillus xylanexedens]